MNRNGYYIPVFVCYFFGILLGTLLCWQLPEECRSSLSIYRMIAEELFLQETGGYVVVQCVIRRLLFFLIVMLTYFSGSACLRYALAGYLGLILSVSISVLTASYHTLGILYAAGIYLPQGILYAWVCCTILSGRERNVYLPRIQFLRCGVCMLSWLVGIALEVLLQPYILRMISFL